MAFEEYRFGSESHTSKSTNFNKLKFPLVKTKTKPKANTSVKFADFSSLAHISFQSLVFNSKYIVFTIPSLSLKMLKRKLHNFSYNFMPPRPEFTATKRTRISSSKLSGYNLMVFFF